VLSPLHVKLATYKYFSKASYRGFARYMLLMYYHKMKTAIYAFIAMICVALFLNTFKSVYAQEKKISSCETHTLCTYDGISYSRLIKNNIPLELYPKNEIEYIGLTLSYEMAN